MTIAVPIVRITLDTAQRFADLIELHKPKIVVTESHAIGGADGMRSSFVTQNALGVTGIVHVVFECVASRELCAEHGALIRESAGTIGAFTATGRIEVPAAASTATGDR